MSPLAAAPARRWQYHSIDTFNSGPTTASVDATSSTTYPAAYLAIYVPIAVYRRCTAVSLWVATQTTGTDNIDLGIYNAQGTRLIHATATAKLASATEQVIDVADTQVEAGLNFMAICCASATATFNAEPGFGGAPIAAAMGLLTENLVDTVELPATATWAVNQTLTFYPLMGFMTNTLVT